MKFGKKVKKDNTAVAEKLFLYAKGQVATTVGLTHESQRFVDVIFKFNVPT